MLTAHLQLDTVINYDLNKLSDIFTDRVDASLLISLDEYGIARDPVTGFTILGHNYNWDYTVITLDMVIEELEEQSRHFWDYVDCNRNQVLHNLELGDIADKTNLTYWISSMMNYRDPWDYIPYNLTINSVIEIFIAGYLQGRDL